MIAPHGMCQTQLYGADFWALCGIYRLPMTSDPRGGASARETSLSMASAVSVLYSLWILTVSTAFYVVRIDNLN